MEFKMSEYGQDLFALAVGLSCQQRAEFEQGKKRLVAAGKVQGGKRTQDVENTFAERVEEYELG